MSRGAGDGLGFVHTARSLAEPPVRETLATLRAVSRPPGRFWKQPGARLSVCFNSDYPKLTAHARMFDLPIANTDELRYGADGDDDRRRVGGRGRSQPLV